MRRHPPVQLRVVGNSPRVIVAEPYYTPTVAIRTAVGVLGAFTVVVAVAAAAAGNGVVEPLASAAVVCLVAFVVGKLTLVRAGSVRGRLSMPGADTAEVMCRLGRHEYEPNGITTEDRLGVTSREQPPRMVWVCARCGDERLAPPGDTPE